MSSRQETIALIRAEALALRQTLSSASQHCSLLFNLIDKNNTFFIDSRALSDFTQQDCQEKVKALLAMYDTDGDGSWSYLQFYRAFFSQTSSLNDATIEAAGTLKRILKLQLELIALSSSIVQFPKIASKQLYVDQSAVLFRAQDSLNKKSITQNHFSAQINLPCMPSSNTLNQLGQQFSMPNSPFQNYLQQLSQIRSRINASFVGRLQDLSSLSKVRSCSPQLRNVVVSQTEVQTLRKKVSNLYQKSAEDLRKLGDHKTKLISKVAVPIRTPAYDQQQNNKDYHQLKYRYQDRPKTDQLRELMIPAKERKSRPVHLPTANRWLKGRVLQKYLYS